MDREIPTPMPNLVLRQLESRDAEPMFELVDGCRNHLSQFGERTAVKYPSVEAVLQSILWPHDPDRTRFGIWHTDTFVGSINLTTIASGEVELGYWLGEKYCGNGFATCAATALSNYALKKEEFKIVRAMVHYRNQASRLVLERSGFKKARSQGFSDLKYVKRR